MTSDRATDYPVDILLRLPEGTVVTSNHESPAVDVATPEGLRVRLCPTRTTRIDQTDLAIAEQFLVAVTAYRDACWRAVAARGVFRDWPGDVE